MKKLLFLPIAGAAFATLAGGALTTHAESTTIDDGSNTGDVTINGTLGADNTDESATINEGSDQWINVTVDTATIFYNTSSSLTIESPEYAIANNSGRPVTVAVKALTQTNSVDISTISNLDVNFTRATTATDTTATTTNTTLITSGAISSSFASAPSLTLANKNGKIASGDATSAYGSTAKFNYSGTVSAKAASVISPNFTMTLTFGAVSWS